MRKNVAGQYLTFGLVNAANGAALTGATVTARRTIDGSAQASCTGTVNEKGNGQYELAASQADTNGNSIGFLFTATGAIPVNLHVYPTAADPTDAAGLGLSRVDAAISTRSSHSAQDAADTLLKRDMAAVTGEAARSPLNSLRAIRNKTSISGGVLTVTKEDDATAAWTATISTDSAAQPIIGVDPA